MENPSKRLHERACRAGFKNALPLWEEAISHVHLGRLSEPIPIDGSGSVQGFPLEGANFDFRFGVEQNEKLMACDDLRRKNGPALRTNLSLRGDFP